MTKNNLACYILTALAVTSSVFAADRDRHVELEELFSLKVKPLLSSKCFGCHGEPGQELKGEFDLTTREGFLRGGEDFPDALVPGSVEKSQVMKMITWEDEDYEMPPKKNDRLNEEQVALIRDWIDAGAIWPDDERQAEIRLAESKKVWTKDGVIIKTSGGLAHEWTNRRYKPEDIWAFQPLKKVDVPSDRKHPIDAFIQSKLGQVGFASAQRADPRTLIRRASYDLIGLPPSSKEVYDYIQAHNQDPEKAWTDLIDRLLASPHYGERWGQHWLDVARYADTGGYSNDYERSNAWRYRDYVIRSFNQDKPYKDFVLEQLAGDELADASVRARSGGSEEKVQQARIKGDYTPEETEQLIATGFLRMGPWDPAMVKNEEARQLYLDDVINAVGQTFLATTMRCFKCHDHKFDPLPTRDYYRLYAAFSTTRMAERPAPFLPDENLAHFDEGRKQVETLLAYATQEKNRLSQKREAAERKWYEEHGKPFLSPDKRKSLPDAEKPPRHAGLNHVEQGQLKVREQDDWIWSRRQERYRPFTQAVYNGSEDQAQGNKARKLRIAPKNDMNWRPESRIFVGGSLEAPGEPVTPGVFSSVPVSVNQAPENDPYALPKTLDHRRLELAKWIADPQNPLATRSIVNRIWQYHFGKPIAGTPNNFGVKGGTPTHPELLDWLAIHFVEGGGRFKELHRLIMTSDAYRQAGDHPDLQKLANIDPNNDLLAYFPSRRLTAEEVRDSSLLISGELNRAMGGLPVMPEINMEVALQPRMIQFSIAPAYQPSPTPEERNRRTIYAYRVRGMADPFLELFNQPNPNDSCAVRDAAAVTPQAFSLMNSATMADRAIAFALRVEGEASEIGEQVKRAFHTIYQRNPTAGEGTRLAAYVRDMQAYHRIHSPEPTTYPTEITRSLVEEFTGAPFEYTEILPAFKNYVRDKKPEDVGPEIRALADLCLVLFNSNEFMYIY
ncbi:MAG: hypothetical protein ACI9QL_001862 [Candidatus Omnitrophota bacterium]|jgi:hypothetical protein